MDTGRLAVGIIALLLVVIVAIYFYTGGAVGIFTYTGTFEQTLIAVMAVVVAIIVLLYLRRKK